jgi:hypothetical protein
VESATAVPDETHQNRRRRECRPRRCSAASDTTGDHPAAGVVDGLRLKGRRSAAVGGDRRCNLSDCATGEADTILGANLADAFTIRTAALTYLAIATTTATPGIAETWTHTGAATAHAITTAINHATNAHVGLGVSAVQTSTARTGGPPWSAKNTACRRPQLVVYRCRRPDGRRRLHLRSPWATRRST